MAQNPIVRWRQAGKRDGVASKRRFWHTSSNDTAISGARVTESKVGDSKYPAKNILQLVTTVSGLRLAERSSTAISSTSTPLKAFRHIRYDPRFGGVANVADGSKALAGILMQGSGHLGALHSRCINGDLASWMTAKYKCKVLWMEDL